MPWNFKMRIIELLLENLEFDICTLAKGKTPENQGADEKHHKSRRCRPDIVHTVGWIPAVVASCTSCCRRPIVCPSESTYCTTVVR
jgi:hypothetical protein